MSYNDDDLDSLDMLLRALPQEPLPITLSELNGYLTGTLAAPDLITPSEWLGPAWSDDGLSDFPGMAAAGRPSML
jgi:uncharacterized protein